MEILVEIRGIPERAGRNGRNGKRAGERVLGDSHTSGGTGGVAEKVGEWRGEWWEVEWWSFWEL